MAHDSKPEQVLRVEVGALDARQVKNVGEAGLTQARAKRREIRSITNAARDEDPHWGFIAAIGCPGFTGHSEVGSN